jgi:L-asparaginase
MNVKKLNFAVISCGGTITMEPSEKGVLEPKKSIDEILAEINLTSLSNEITIPKELRIELFKFDSADLNSEHWEQIITTIENLQDKCDGILVLHGTDTMSYSATATGLVLSQKLRVPVIFTGSQSPIDETGSDGKTNVERSLLILQKTVEDKTIECMIFFGDKAYRAVSSRKRSESDFDAFESPSVRPLYIVGGLGVRSILSGRKAEDVELSKNRIGISLRNKFAKGVIILPIIPGLEANVLMTIAEKDTTNAIILYSLGAGNVPALEGENNLIPSIGKITKELNKPVIIASPFVGGSTNMDIYLPGLLAKNAGAINAGKMTSEATVVKTKLLLAQPEFANSLEKLQHALLADFAGETGNV